MKIGIMGAGAAGIMAAITAAQCGGEVILFEKNDRVGKKLLATGNGKCNLSNLSFEIEEDYYCEDFDKLEKMFALFSVWDTITFFESCGLMIKNKNGYLYPYSEQASTVLDVLRRLLNRPEIEIRTGEAVLSASFDEKRKQFRLITEKGETPVDRLIVACGSPASFRKGEEPGGYQIAKTFGHQVRALMPALVALRTDEPCMNIMAGVRCGAGLELLIDGEQQNHEKGELQLTDYGISGIPVFQFSRQAGYALAEGKKVSVLVDFFPEYEERIFDYQIQSRYESMPEATLEEYLTGMLNKKINTAMIKRAGFKPDQKISQMGFSSLKKFMAVFKHFELHITAPNGMENAQVCAGGVSFREISTEMESLKQKGLYFAGELVDVDGKCGGYNLQWAWTSGYAAGRSAAGGFAAENQQK